MSGYAVAHEVSCRGASGADAPCTATKSGVALSSWPAVPFTAARDRLARGTLVFKVAEIVAMLGARATEFAQDADRIGAARKALGLAAHCPEVHGARARAEEMRAVTERVRALRDGDVPAARALRFALTAQSAAQSRLHDYESCRARARAEGAGAVRQYLIPSRITWWGPDTPVTDSELEILSRVMSGVSDVRLGGAPGAASEAGPVYRVSRDEWRAMLTADDARRPPWDRSRGVLMYRPDEVAEILETEARLYEDAADRLSLTRARDGEGTALRHLGKDLRAELWRVSKLAPGDIVGPVRCLPRSSASGGTTRGAPPRPMAPVGRPSRSDGAARRGPAAAAGGRRPGVPARPRGTNETEVYRRWEAGEVDVRDAVWGPPTTAADRRP